MIIREKDGEKMSSLLEYKCPCCGGAIEFNTEVQRMKCPYCDTEFDVEAMQQYDQELQEEKPDHIHWDTSAGGQWTEDETTGMRLYVCESCGGEIVGDENTAATKCPYCDNPVVMMEQFTGGLKPDYVIPFKLDKEKAKEVLKNFYKGKRLLPRNFKDENHIDEIRGIYVPYWLFDADTEGTVRYKATKVTGHWSDSDYNYTQISVFSVIRGGTLQFENVPADGSSKMADDMMESLEPYYFSEAVDFQTAYLAGYLADKYDVTSDECIERVNQRMKKSTEDSFRETVHGYGTVETSHSSIQVENGKAKYALYPVWILNTRWKGENFTFAVNGQTGKIAGRMPVDWAAFWRWFAGITVVVAILAYLVMYIFLR